MLDESHMDQSVFTRDSSVQGAKVPLERRAEGGVRAVVQLLCADNDGEADPAATD